MTEEGKCRRLNTDAHTEDVQITEGCEETDCLLFHRVAVLLQRLSKIFSLSSVRRAGAQSAEEVLENKCLSLYFGACVPVCVCACARVYVCGFLMP